MRIAVIGGGPGGLFFGRLIKRLRPGWDVVVWERNAPDATFGFGVGFGGPTLPALEGADAEVYAAVVRAGVVGSGMTMRHRGAVVGWPGFDFLTVGRRRLLGILQEHAAVAGAELRFGKEADPGAVGGGFDLIVAADGANSPTRRDRAAHFGTAVEEGRARYMWLGTPVRFPNITFSIRQTEAGAFAIHAYPYASDASTVVVETDEATWRRAGLDRTDPGPARPGGGDLEAAAYLGRVFEEDLEGRGLLTNNSRWLVFRTIRNRRWRHGNVVLLGDAAHTAHYSIGSGTKMAMEDAIELAAALDEHPADVPRALSAYEGRRRPKVEHLQSRSDPSRAWWDTFGSRAKGMDAETLFFSYLTRTGAVSYEQVREQNPSYVGSLTGRLAAPRPAAPPTDPPGAAPPPGRPLHAPLRLRSLVLANRIVASAPDGLGAQPFPGGGLDPPGLAVGPVASPPAREGARAVGVRVPVGASTEELLSARQGFQIIELTPDAADEPHAALIDRVRLLRSRPGPTLVSVRLPALAPNGRTPGGEEAALRLAKALKEAGGDLLVRLPPPRAGARPGEDADDRARLLTLSERIRLDLGLPTVLEWPPDRAGDADTAILAGRVDLVDLRPAPSA